MKTFISAVVLFAMTVTGILLYPADSISSAPTQPIIETPIVQRGDRPQIEVVFALDTTSSMSGMIEAAKEKIWSIASSMAQAQPTPVIKMGLVAYRDRGDDYVTKVIDLSEDLDSMYATLMGFRAIGGGDGPESVNQALYDAVNRISWSQSQDSYKVVFLVGDAPPHMDYKNDVKYPVTLAQAKNKGIVVNSIQAGSSGSTTSEWQKIAQLGTGEFFQVNETGNAVAVATPFDAKIASLSAELDGTRLYYGDAETKAKQKAKVDATAKVHRESSVTAQARRGAFNASKSGAANFLGESELVDDVVSGRKALEDIDKAELPAPMQAMKPADQQRLLTETHAKRRDLSSQIEALAGKRQNYIKQQLAAEGGAEESLDEKIYDAVRSQAKAKGFDYAEEAAVY